MTMLERIRAAIRFTSRDVDPDEQAANIAKVVLEARRNAFKTPYDRRRRITPKANPTPADRSEA